MAGLQGEPAVLPPSLHRLAPAGRPSGHLFEIPKALAGNQKAFPCNPSGRQTLPGWRLPPKRISLHNFHLKRSLGPWWPILLGPINALGSGMQSEGALPAEGGGRRKWGTGKYPQPGLGWWVYFV